MGAMPRVAYAANVSQRVRNQCYTGQTVHGYVGCSVALTTQTCAPMAASGRGGQKRTVDGELRLLIANGDATDATVDMAVVPVDAQRRASSASRVSSDEWGVVLQFLRWRDVVCISSVCSAINRAAHELDFSPNDRIVIGKALFRSNKYMPHGSWALRGAQVVASLEVEATPTMRFPWDWYARAWAANVTDLCIDRFGSDDHLDIAAPFLRSLQSLSIDPYKHQDTDVDWPRLVDFENRRRVPGKDGKLPSHLVSILAATTTTACVGRMGDGSLRLTAPLVGSSLLANLKELHLRTDDASTRMVVSNCPKLERLTIETIDSDYIPALALYAAMCPTLQYIKLPVVSDGEAVPVNWVDAQYRDNPPAHLSLRRIVARADFDTDENATLLVRLIARAGELREFNMLSFGTLARHIRAEHVDVLSRKPHLSHLRVVVHPPMSILTSFSPWPALTHLSIDYTYATGPDEVWSFVGLNNLVELVLRVRPCGSGHFLRDPWVQLFQRLPQSLRVLVVSGDMPTWTPETTLQCHRMLTNLKVATSQDKVVYGQANYPRFDWSKIF
jgi:hypothetical protein